MSAIFPILTVLFTGCSAVKNSTLAQSSLCLHYIRWGSPDEHLAVSSTEFRWKITEIHGSEVYQSLSGILSHIVAGNFRFFLFLNDMFIFIQGSRVQSQPGTILLRRLIVKSFLRPFCSIQLIQEGLLLVTSESMCTKYWLAAKSSLPRKKCGQVN